MKQRIGKLDFIKITNICSVNDNEKTNQKLGENTCKDVWQKTIIGQIYTKNSENSTIRKLPD